MRLLLDLGNTRLEVGAAGRADGWLAQGAVSMG